MRKIACIAAVAAFAFPAVALADDPNDPAMRSRAARERDRQQIRKLNLDQLAYVRQRDAGYAGGWADWKAARGGASNENYARQRAQHDRDMARWRAQVAACRAGDYSACGE